MTTAMEDPAVKLPRQVRDANRASDRAVQNLNQQPPAPQAPVVPPTITDTPAPPQPGSQPDATAVVPKPVADLEQRYRVIKGKYDAEVPRLAAEVRALKERIATLEKENQALKTGAPDKAKEHGTMTPERRKELGEDYVKTHQEIAQDVVAPQTAALNQKIAALEAEVAQTRRNALFDALTEICPPWREINALDSWKAWLGEQDPSTGYDRQDLLNKHLSSADAYRISAMFKAWADTYPDEYEAVAQGKPVTAIKLERQIVPERTIAEPPRQVQPATVTREYIRQFHKDMALGKYARAPERAKEIERLIQEAVSTGNVR